PLFLNFLSHYQATLHTSDTHTKLYSKVIVLCDRVELADQLAACVGKYLERVGCSAAAAFPPASHGLCSVLHLPRPSSLFCVCSHFSYAFSLSLSLFHRYVCG